MNKDELAGALADRTGLNKQMANQAVEAVFRCIAEALNRGEAVRVLGFGSFIVTDRGATTGRNPKTGEILEIKPSRQPKFRPGKGLKDALNT